jgi:hypothetical protein
MSGLAFLNPLLLAGLIALPAIWWLLRTVPPAPKRIEFPATRILVGIEDKEKQPDKTPWWLTLIRMLAATLMIFALAEPVLNPIKRATLAGNGPVAIVIDNGWAAAPRWAERQTQMERLIAEAEQAGRAVVIAPTARVARFASLKVEAAAQARAASAAVQPYPHAPERDEAGTALTQILRGQTGVSVYWISDGIDHDGKARQFGDALAALARGGSATLIELPVGQEALAVSANLGQGGRLDAQVFRADGVARQGVIHALSARGQRLAEAKFGFSPNSASATTTFELPLELRNQVSRIEIAGERSAGGVHLLDARSQWHRIGLLSGTAREQAQPLLAPLYYLERALLPFAELAKSEDANMLAAIEGLIKRNISVLMLADIGTLPKDIRDKLDLWVKKGGILVRFAGPRLEQGGDDLIAAPLRAGGRQLGGALSWSTPQPLATFDETSLFAGLAVPAEVQVTRQVLADPAKLGGSDIKSWARLKDGTPLVTAAKRGDGQLVLFHVTANSDWSNLPLSGLFIDMLRRVATLGKPGGVSLTSETNSNAPADQAAETADVLPPYQTLDGFGVLKAPPPTAQSIAANKINEATPSADNPPGYYGPQGSPRALNLVGPKTVLKPLPALPAPFERRAVDTAAPRPLKPALLSSALALIFADILATLALAGAFLGLGRAFAKRTAGALVLAVLAVLAGVAASSPAEAQFNDRNFNPRDILRDLNRPQGGGNTFTQQLGRPRIPTPVPADPAARSQMATGKVTFGFVLSGDPNTDKAAEQGLRGLNTFLIAKTAVDPGEPMGVNIRADEIAFFPMLYWPVPSNAQALPDVTLAKIDAYMKSGGMIIFDTRDAGTSFMPGGFNRQADRMTPLQRLLGTLDIPRLEPVPETHVLTKSFYLLKAFPGRYDNGQLWVEAEAPADSGRAKQARRVDGVSSILVTSNDFASAWALDERNTPLFPVIPGGEPQREMAFRTGVNIVMYALTGNYKADQVHVPALLERLGN